MHEILATAMVLGARKDRGGQILPNLMFRIQKRHISGTIMSYFYLGGVDVCVWSFNIEDGF